MWYKYICISICFVLWRSFKLNIQHFMNPFYHMTFHRISLKPWLSPAWVSGQSLVMVVSMCRFRWGPSVVCVSELSGRSILFVCIQLRMHRLCYIMSNNTSWVCLHPSITNKLFIVLTRPTMVLLSNHLCHKPYYMFTVW